MRVWNVLEGQACVPYAMYVDVQFCMPVLSYT